MTVWAVVCFMWIGTAEARTCLAAKVFSKPVSDVSVPCLDLLPPSLRSQLMSCGYTVPARSNEALS